MLAPLPTDEEEAASVLRYPGGLAIDYQPPDVVACPPQSALECKPVPSLKPRKGGRHVFDYNHPWSNRLRDISDAAQQKITGIIVLPFSDSREPLAWRSGNQEVDRWERWLLQREVAVACRWRQIRVERRHGGIAVVVGGSRAEAFHAYS